MTSMGTTSRGDHRGLHRKSVPRPICGNPVSPSVTGVSPRPSLLDWCIAAGFMTVVVFEALGATVDRPAVHVAIGIPAMFALAWRRRWPLLVTGVVVLCQLSIDRGADFSVVMSLVLMAFTVGAELGQPRSTVGLALVVVPFLISLYVFVGELVPSDFAAAAVFLGGSWAGGRMLRQRSATAEWATERADRLEREKALEAELAAAAERTRIARELHDIVSHSISVISMHTQAVRRRLGSDHERESRDLAAVESLARDAMVEMRRLFGLLRTDGERTPLEPQPGLGELDQLLDQVRATGLHVTVEREDIAVPAGLDLTAYRIVQEAITNVIRHSGATRLHVRIARAPRGLEITVDDDGNGLQAGPGGHGLLGIRERAELYGGSLDVCASPEGGVRVMALLPTTGQT